MELVQDWKKVLRHANSIRWVAAAMVFTGAEAAFPFFTETFDLDPRWFAAIAFALMGAAFGSRLIAQKVFQDDKQ